MRKAASFAKLSVRRRRIAVKNRTLRVDLTAKSDGYRTTKNGKVRQAASFAKLSVRRRRIAVKDRRLRVD